MPLPMKLWIALEDDVARHKAELAQAFAQARERLLPEPVSVWPEAAEAAWHLQRLLAPANAIRDPRTGLVIWEQPEMPSLWQQVFGSRLW